MPTRVPPAKCSDLGNAQRLVARNAEIIRFVKATDCWHVWTDKRWAVDETGQVDRLARDTVEWMQRGANDLPADSEKQKDAKLRAQKWAVASESAARLSAMIALARFEPGIAVLASEFDGRAHELNTPSGIVDLKTGALRPSDPAAMHTLSTTAAYTDSEAECPHWEAFLEKVLPDKPTRNYVHKLLGLSLVGETPKGDEIPFLFGPGGTGKSTVLETVKEVLGDYAIVAPSQLLKPKHGSSHTYDLARLRGKRFVIANEIDGKVDEGTLKAITANDLSGRQIRERETTWDNSVVLWMVSNSPLRINGADFGLRRRIKQIEMDVVLDGPGYVGPMREAFVKEHAGILAWLVRGGIAARKGLVAPARVDSSTADLFDSANPLLLWVGDACEHDPLGWQSGADLHASYESWCDQRRQRSLYPSHASNAWSKALVGQLGLERSKRHNRQGYLGLRLLAPPL